MGKLVVRILTESDESILRGFLDRHLESSMILYGNLLAAGLRFSGQRYEGIYAGAFDEGKLISVLSHCWNQNLVLQAPVHIGNLIREAVNVSGLPIAGLLGPVEQLTVAKSLLGLTPDQLRYDSREKLYSLNLIDMEVPVLLSSRRVRGRLAKPEDIEMLSEWRIAYLMETMAEPFTPALIKSSRDSVSRMVAEKQTWLIESAGEIVACSSLNATARTGGGTGVVQVGGVWTPPALRGNHYGRAAVATSLIDVKATGFTRAILFTGEKNFPAQKAYTALGFRHIGAYGMSFPSTPLRPFDF